MSSSSSSSARDYTTDDEDNLAQRLFKKCNREFVFALYTPFLVCLAAGELKYETFKYYLYQDIDYLEACIEVIEQALKTTNDEDAKEVLCKFQSSDERERQRLKLMLGPDTKYPINEATTKYKKFFFDIVYGEIKIDGRAIPNGPIIAIFILGAMMPCWRLYAALGQKILAALGGEADKSNPYKKWIESNGDPRLEESTKKVEQVLNDLCATVNPEKELGIIENLYRKSMELEVEFFLAPKLNQSSLVPLIKKHDGAAQIRLIIFSGFEKTCTTEDSPILLDGCSSFLKRLVVRNLNPVIHLLSGSWSDELIQSAFSSAGLNDLNVHVNQLEFDESPEDKLRVLKDILNDYNHIDEDNNNFKFYIGDPFKDFLVEEDPAGSRSLDHQRVVVLEGVSFAPLFSSLVKMQKETADGSLPNWNISGSTLYTVSSWDEVEAFTLGWEN